MKTIKSFSAIIMLSAVLLVSALVVAPTLQAQADGPPEPVPPGRQVEVVAPLPLPVEGNITGSVDVNNFPETQNVNVVNGQDAPIPVTVQVSSKEIIRGVVDITFKGQNDLDAYAVPWRRPDGTGFTDLPEGYALFITDIIVSNNQVFFSGTPDEPFDLVFVHLEDGGAGRLWDLGGTGLPYSLSFQTPMFFPFLTGAGGKLGITRLTDERLEVTLIGYLEPITQ